MAWLDDQPGGVLAFSRDDRFTCVVNLSDSAVPLPPHVEVLLASGPLDGSSLPSDMAVWLRT
jgi:alpha-glucosidase